MTRIAVDIGNSRVKWGRCGIDSIEAVVSLASDDDSAWTRQLEAWRLDANTTWIIGGVQPKTRDRFVAWLATKGHRADILRDREQLPITLAVDHPETVGLDRLFNAIAAAHRGGSALIVDAGSAVTVDFVDAAGVFQGGAILPGLNLMARALHEHTAQLPQVEIVDFPVPPAKSTVMALRTGIAHAVVGGINLLLAEMSAARPTPTVYLTGGDAAFLASRIAPKPIVWPEMTLEGIRMSSQPRRFPEKEPSTE